MVVIMGSWWKVGGIIGILTVVEVVGRKLPVSPPELRKLDWWENTVIYQIYPRSFKDSDGDGIGDLRGIISQLKHFVESGIGTIWLAPIFQSPMVDCGYDVSDFYEIHHEYGTMEDFLELVRKAHQLGLKVLLDYVPNHASIKSEYFLKSEAREPGYENFFVWGDPVVPDPNNPSQRKVPSNWISQFGGSIWEWSEVRQQYYLHQFAVEQADFNFREPAVRQEMLNILRFWLERGVDGFRVDALPHFFEANPDDYGGVYPDEPLNGYMFLNADQIGNTTQEHIKDLMEIYDVVYEWRDFIDNWRRQNGSDTKILLTEAYCNITLTILYYGDERKRVGAHFPFNFDFVTSLSANSNARDFAYVIQRWLTYMPYGNVANWVFGNHDHSRLPSRFRTNMVDGLNALNMLLPGVAITYQGEEIGMRDGFVSWEDTVDIIALNKGNSSTYQKYSRDPSRTPFHWNNTTNAGFSTSSNTWLPVADDYTTLNLQAQKEADRSHYLTYQRLTSLRRQVSLSHGNTHVQALTQNTLVLVRHLITYDTYSLVFNVGTAEDTVNLTRIPQLQEPLTVYTSSIHSSRMAGDSVSLGKLTLQPGEALVLQSAPT